jgi:hypothetical protein
MNIVPFVQNLAQPILLEGYLDRQQPAEVCIIFTSQPERQQMRNFNLVHKSTFYSCLNFDTIYKLITLKYFLQLKVTLKI